MRRCIFTGAAVAVQDQNIRKELIFSNLDVVVVITVVVNCNLVCTICLDVLLTLVHISIIVSMWKYLAISSY